MTKRKIVRGVWIAVLFATCIGLGIVAAWLTGGCVPSEPRPAPLPNALWRESQEEAAHAWLVYVNTIGGTDSKCRLHRERNAAISKPGFIEREVHQRFNYKMANYGYRAPCIIWEQPEFDSWLTWPEWDDSDASLPDTT